MTGVQTCALPISALQTTKGSISEVLKGFQKEKNTNGIKIYTVKGWDYASLCETFEEGIRFTRATHTPVVFHIQELTQPQGHSTSGSHERYKPMERLEWERNWDCNKKMREWIIDNELATDTFLDEIEQEAKQMARASKLAAWEKYLAPVKEKIKEAVTLIQQGLNASDIAIANSLLQELVQSREPLKRDIFRTVNLILEKIPTHPNAAAIQLFLTNYKKAEAPFYSQHLYNEGPKSALNVSVVEAT